MTRPRLILAEYARLTRPSPHRFEARSRRACATVFFFTLGTTQRAWVGGRTAGGGGGGGGGGGSGGGGRGGGGGCGDLVAEIKVPSILAGGTLTNGADFGDVIAQPVELRDDADR